MRSIFIAISLFFSCVVSAQDITGHWQGMIPVNGKNLRLLFHVTKTGNSYSSKFDSPDQNAFGITCNNTRVESDSLIIGIELIKGGYKGKWMVKMKFQECFFRVPVILPLDLNA